MSPLHKAGYARSADGCMHRLHQCVGTAVEKLPQPNKQQVLPQKRKVIPMTEEILQEIRNTLDKFDKAYWELDGFSGVRCSNCKDVPIPYVIFRGEKIKGIALKNCNFKYCPQCGRKMVPLHYD